MGWVRAGRGPPACPGNKSNRGNRLGRKASGARKAARDARAEQMLDVLAEIARHGETEFLRLHAADKVLDRLMGKPKAAVPLNVRKKRQAHSDGPPIAETMEEWMAMVKAEEEARKHVQ